MWLLHMFCAYNLITVLLLQTYVYKFEFLLALQIFVDNFFHIICLQFRRFLRNFSVLLLHFSALVVWSLSIAFFVSVMF